MIKNVADLHAAFLLGAGEIAFAICIIRDTDTPQTD